MVRRSHWALPMTLVGALIGVGSEAPSTTLLRKVVPLPRYRGGGKKNHPTFKPIRFAIRFRCICEVPAAIVAARASR